MKQNLKAQQHYETQIQNIQNMLTRLSQANSENFNVSSDNADWSNVAMASDIEYTLKTLLEKLFYGGEYALT